MYKIPLDELKNKIIVSGKLTPRDLEKKIKDKVNELSGLISEEGAVIIIANELGINVLPQQQEKLKVKEIYAGMRNVSVAGKVVRKFEVREFAKGERTGKVGSLILGDETGTIRVVFWNEQVEQLEKIQEGDVLLVKEAYVRENKGGKEVHLGERGEVVINPLGETVGTIRPTPTFVRKKIQELQTGEEGIEILGTVVQVFDPRFFQVCPQCNKRLNEDAGKFSCVEHGVVTPVLSYVLNLVLDDGTGTIRSVFWKNQINHLLEKEESVMIKYKDNPAQFEEVKNDLLGEQFRLIGRVKNNEMFERLEFNVQTVEKALPEKEIERLEKGTIK